MIAEKKAEEELKKRKELEESVGLRELRDQQEVERDESTCVALIQEIEDEAAAGNNVSPTTLKLLNHLKCKYNI